MGGSDQWGNITTGTELIRRMGGGEAFAFTCPLLTKADGGKFGKTERGNVWLDPTKTSPYQFYQFWLNASDEDATKWIKIFSFLSKEEIDGLIAQHQEAPHQRLLQKKLAESITTLVHGADEFAFAVKASEILFGNATTEVLAQLNEVQLLQVLDGVPQVDYSKASLDHGVDIVSFLAESGIFSSKGEARKMVQNGGISLNKNKVKGIEAMVGSSLLLNERYMLIQKGRREYFLVKAV